MSCLTNIFIVASDADQSSADYTDLRLVSARHKVSPLRLSDSFDRKSLFDSVSDSVLTLY